MTKKIAFISQSVIRINKSFENEVPKSYEDIEIAYEHPVLSLVRKTKKDKDYINIYCGRPTYVLMKVRETFIEKFIDALKDVLFRAKIDEEQINKIESEIRIYSRFSEIIEQIIIEVNKEALSKAKALMFTLGYFDTIMRKTIKKCIIKNIIRQVLRKAARKYYRILTDEIKARYTISNFINLVMQEINFKKIAKSIYKNINDD